MRSRSSIPIKPVGCSIASFILPPLHFILWLCLVWYPFQASLIQANNSSLSFLTCSRHDTCCSSMSY
ncbi:hypothetical protein BD410DRAFT_507606 [Rickenella mellea]|uniref:Uncharacterized protein n=1 Tax=Rickenella mellea TaxID=50990 RepID=A0A4Y7PT20_9AGAM|nr:hypothetical protein BD410DRAFT_507606 [Rickenella mellea]